MESVRMRGSESENDDNGQQRDEGSACRSA